jgi:hypothetical protein
MLKSRQSSISGGYVIRPITSEFRKSGDGDVKNSYYRSPEVKKPKIVKRSGPSNHLECGLFIRLPFKVSEIGRWRCDQGIKFCSKFQSARNATKPVPLRPSRLPDSGGIFTLSNGLRMEKISRSVRQVKQAKILVLTVQSVQSDVAGPYRPYG